MKRTPTYQVVKLVVDASINRRLCGFKVSRYYATYLGREPSDKDPFLEVWADRSITLNADGKRIFLCDDQWLGISTALNNAIDDKRKSVESAKNNWLANTIDATEFYGVHVDLTRRQVIEAIAECQIEIIVQEKKWTTPIIFFRGEGHILLRTDLHDDVATSPRLHNTAEEWRTHYLGLAQTCLGARLTEGKHYPAFAIIDSLTDG